MFVNSANLDLVRSIFAGFQRGDFFSSLEWAHPKIEFVRAHELEPGSLTGKAEMTRAWGEVLSAWEEYCVEVDEYRELDGDRVLVLTHARGRGKASGLDLGKIQTAAASLFQFRSGKVTRIVLYADRERALADLGLAPDTDAGSRS